MSFQLSQAIICLDYTLFVFKLFLFPWQQCVNMSTSTHMGTYPCICSSSQQHSSLKRSHLQKLASCSLSPVAEQKNENQYLSDSDTVYQLRLANQRVPHMTKGKPLVKVKIVMPSDMQALLQFSSLPVLLFFQDLSIVPINSMGLLLTVYSNGILHISISYCSLVLLYPHIEWSTSFSKLVDHSM